MSLTLVKQNRCVLLKYTSDSYCVYKGNGAVLASFLLVGVTVRAAQRVLCRHHQSLSARIVYLLHIVCSFIVTFL